MAPKRQRRQNRDHTPDLETNIAPGAPDDPRREDATDSPPPRANRENISAGGGFTPAEDGCNPQHPIHDEDQEDADSSVYEREIDRLNAAVQRR
jgi:hypothetical protein